MANAPPGFRFQAELANGDCLFRAIARQHYGDPARFQDVRNDVFNEINSIVDDSPTEEKIAFWNRFRGDIEDGVLDSLPADQAVLGASEGYQALLARFREEGTGELFRQIRAIERESKPPVEYGDWRGDGIPLVYMKLYAYLMKERGTWGGSFEVTLLARKYNKYIVIYVIPEEDDDEPPANPYAGREVYLPSGEPGEIPPGTPANQIITLKYNGINHYDSFIRVAGAAGAGAAAAAAAAPGGEGGAGKAKSRSVSAAKSGAPGPSKLPLKKRVSQAILDSMAGGSKKPSEKIVAKDIDIIQKQEAAGYFDTKDKLRKWIEVNKKAGQLQLIVDKYGIEGGVAGLERRILEIKSGGGRVTKKALRKRKTQKKK